MALLDHKGILSGDGLERYPRRCTSERSSRLAQVDWQVDEPRAVCAPRSCGSTSPLRTALGTATTGKNFTDRHAHASARPRAFSGRALARALPLADSPRGARRDAPGGRGRAVGHGHGEQGVAAHRVRRSPGALRVGCAHDRCKMSPETGRATSSTRMLMLVRAAAWRCSWPKHTPKSSAQLRPERGPLRARTTPPPAPARRTETGAAPRYNRRRAAPV